MDGVSYHSLPRGCLVDLGAAVGSLVLCAAAVMQHDTPTEVEVGLYDCCVSATAIGSRCAALLATGTTAAVQHHTQSASAGAESSMGGICPHVLIENE